MWNDVAIYLHRLTMKQIIPGNPYLKLTNTSSTADRLVLLVLKMTIKDVTFDRLGILRSLSKTVL